MDAMLQRLAGFGAVFLRLGLGFSFLSAVADRVGWWGAYGQPHVAWGDFARFVAYTGRLNWFLPGGAIPALAVVVTGIEIALGLLLVGGWQTRIAAFCSGVLLTAFALAMAVALGVKAPLDFSVFSAAGGSFLLAACPRYPFSVDGWRGTDREAR